MPPLLASGRAAATLLPLPSTLAFCCLASSQPLATISSSCITSTSTSSHAHPITTTAPGRGDGLTAATSNETLPTPDLDKIEYVDGPFDPFNALTSRLDQPQLEGSPDHQPLSSWKVGVKANICIQDTITSCSSKMLRDYRPTFDATAVSRLRTSGAIIAAQTNCDEFGMGSENVHSYYGPVRNPAKHVSSSWVKPWDLSKERSAGGSSGGSAAAVKAGLVRVALGSDTGGSVRLPAAYCGVVGLKPSYGMISRWGLVSYADSLDTIGILTRDVGDAEQTFQVLASPDPQDPTCVDDQVRNQAAETVERVLSTLPASSSESLVGLRVGIPIEYFPLELHQRVVPPFRQAVARLKQLGAEIVSISLPNTPYALSAYYVISCAEASSNLARYDGIEYGYRSTTPSTSSSSSSPYAKTRTQAFGQEVRKRILLGTYALTADAYDNYFLKAAQVRKSIQNDFQNVFRIPNPLSNPTNVTLPSKLGVDVLLHPSAVNTAPTLGNSMASGETRNQNNPSISAYVQDVLTVPASLAGLPAISLPVGTVQDDGWPVGVTALSQWGCEPLLFRIGLALSSLNQNVT